MLMILARLVRSESFWAVVKVRSPHTGPEVSYPRRLTPPACPPALPGWLIRSFHLDLVEYRREGRVAETRLVSPA